MCSHCSPFLTASLYSSQAVLQPCRLHTLGAFCKHKWVCQPPLSLTAGCTAQRFCFPRSNKAMPGCRCAATSLKFTHPSVSSHQNNQNYFLALICYYRQPDHQIWWCRRLRAMKQHEVSGQLCKKDNINHHEMLQKSGAHFILHLQLRWWNTRSISSFLCFFSVTDKKRGVYSQ